jgi:VWFA-related protein
MKTVIKVFLTLGWALLCYQAIAAQQTNAAQTGCLTADEIKNMLAQVNRHPEVAFDQLLSERLIRLKEKNNERLSRDVADNKKPEDLMKRLRDARQKNAVELCEILKTYGWPSKALAGSAGVDAAFFLLRDSAPFDLQVGLLPVVVAATKLGEIPRPEFAAYVDLLRLRTGQKQLFGTQAALLDGFLVLYPIEAEAQVDARRKQYGLAPLAVHLRNLEQTYRLPLIKSTGTLANSFSDSAKKAVAETTGQLEARPADEVEVVRVDTNLVNLNVSVYSSKLKAHVGTLEKEDFTIVEDGRHEAISYFGRTDVPFDLVLLIDLSGSTQGKRDLIRKTTQRFIEAARPSDRLAIVTFADTPTVVAPLTDDRAKLLQSVKNIDGNGGSRVWDALEFVLDQVVGPKTLARRRAVVFMTDGADNALLSWGNGLGSRTSFADLLETVRRNDTLIIPIYLDTEGRDPWSHMVYENARKTLARLAEESGGLYYKARKIEDLNDVYGQVIDDLGKVYSLGYRPTNDKRDGRWRTVEIGIPNHPELQGRTRPGYYAN